MKIFFIATLALFSINLFSQEIEIINCNIEFDLGKARILLNEVEQKYVYQISLSNDEWQTFFKTNETAIKASGEKLFVDFLEPAYITDELRVAVRIEIDGAYNAVGEGEHQVQIGPYSYPRYYLNNCVGHFLAP